MPLIKIAKKEPEPPYVFTSLEKEALEILPEEQIRASNHNPRLISLMIQDEARDASPEHTVQDVYKALENSDPYRLLAATKNLTVQERNRIVQGIYNHILAKTQEITPEDIRRITTLTEDSIDLFDLCVRLKERTKRK